MNAGVNDLWLVLVKRQVPQDEAATGATNTRVPAGGRAWTPTPPAPPPPPLPVPLSPPPPPLPNKEPPEEEEEEEEEEEKGVFTTSVSSAVIVSFAVSGSDFAHPDCGDDDDFASTTGTSRTGALRVLW